MYGAVDVCSRLYASTDLATFISSYIGSHCNLLNRSTDGDWGGASKIILAAINPGSAPASNHYKKSECDWCLSMVTTSQISRVVVASKRLNL
jgi:hypothetical protein